MKRSIVLTLLAALLLLLPFSTVLAFEWGGSFSTTNTFESVPEDSDEEEFSSDQKVVLYLSSNLGPNWEFLGQVGAKIAEDPLFAADVEKLYLQRNRAFTPENEQPAGLVGMTTRYGRFLMSEPTGKIMSHPVDGAAFILSYVNFELYAGAGYTGLINKEFSTVSMSLQDSVDSEDDDIYFGPARLLGLLRLSLPEVALGQTAHLAFAVQEDLRNPDQVVQIDEEPVNVEEAGGLVDTLYGIARLEGPVGIVPGLFYSLSYGFNGGRTLSKVEDDTAETGESYQYQPFMGHLLDGEVQLFLPRLLSSVITAGGTFTTGDTDNTSFTEGNTKGAATQFTAVTPGSSGIVYGLQPGNSTIAEVSYSAKPLGGSSVQFLSTLQAALSWYGFFRTAGEGFVSVGDVDGDTSGSYLGSEVDLAVNLRPFSDLGIGVSGGMFFGNDAVMYDDVNSTDWLVRLNASLSF